MKRVRPFQAAEWPLYRTLRLRALASDPEAFGSTLALEAARGDEDWAWRLALAAGSGRDCPLVAELDGEAAGLAWAKCDQREAGLVNLFQMWVAPEARGQGLASLLLDSALAWAAARGASTMQLTVMCGNDAARGLYERSGFRDVGAPQPPRPGDKRLEQAMRVELASRPQVGSYQRI